MGEILRTLRFTLLFFAVTGCVPDPCSDPASPEDFSACRPLCGEYSPTAADCHLEMPAFPSGLFRWDYESLLEESVNGGMAIEDRWFMGETGEGIVEILDMPFGGIASTRPAAQLRASDPVPVPGSTGMSLYLRYFTGQESCVLEIASVTSWKMWDKSSENFAVPFVRASMIIGREGDCEDTMFRGLEPGLAWKTTGQITKLVHDLCPPPESNPRPDQMDVPPLDCSSDGYCNPFCLFDPDCRCRSDGVCDRDCAYDPDCDCGADYYCDPDCPDDPDCACLADGVCNADCLNDPDCRCMADGVCDADCPYDPDCRCMADGLCDPECPADPDCTCLEDGYCDPACGNGDPDCLCAAEGRCQCECLRLDPDCACTADGVCSSPMCGWLDEDCRCVSDTVCNPMCEETDPDCGEEEP